MSGGQLGTLYTVLVERGRTRWGVQVRAASEEEARKLAAAQGHAVVEVRESAARTVALQLVPGACERCGYDLARLKAGEAGVLICPECGALNLPYTPGPPSVGWAARRWVARFGCLAMLALLAVALWSLPMVFRLL